MVLSATAFSSESSRLELTYYLFTISGAACADKYYEITDSQGTAGWLVNGTTDPSLVFMVGETVTFHYTQYVM